MRISVTGDSIPPPVGTFEDMTLPLGVSSWLRHGIEDIGWLEPTPIQMQAIPCLLAGQVSVPRYIRESFDGLIIQMQAIPFLKP
jgi:superfamily II DNA/RNA helicase